MSALLAQATAIFEFKGANVTLSCTSPEELLGALAKFGIAANDKVPATGNVKQAAVTVAAGSTGTQTAASSAQTAAAPAAQQADAGNASGSTPSSSEPSGSPAVTFDELKKAFLALSTKAGGREKCEAVLKPFNLPKLSAASPEQYAAVMAEIKKQAGE